MKANKMRPKCSKCESLNIYHRGMGKPESERERVCRTCGHIENVVQSQNNDMKV
jgi:hypothetical protein